MVSPTPPSFDTYLEIELTDLQPSEDPFREAKEMRSRRAVTPGACTSAPSDDVPAMLPLQPVVYHVELTDCTGENSHLIQSISLFS